MANKAIFLDRDNTLIYDSGYINTPEQLSLIEGVGSCLRELQKMDYKLIIVTNQSGIARGILTENDLELIHARLKRLLADYNVFIDGIFYCPFHPDGIIEKYKMESNLRKPNSGMLFQAVSQFDIDLKQSWMIGDSQRDIDAGRGAGCRTIMIKTPSSSAQIKYTADNADFVVTNFKEATNIIIKHNRNSQKPTIENKLENKSYSIEISEPKKNEQYLEDISTDTVKINQEDLEQEITMPQNNQHNSIQEMLGEIIQLLKSIQRQKMFNEFSGFRLVGVVLQGVVVLIVLLSLFMIVKSGISSGAAYIGLLFAIVIQLMALTFLYMSDKN